MKKRITITEPLLCKIVKENRSITQVGLALGYKPQINSKGHINIGDNPRTIITKLIDKYEIDTSHFALRKHNVICLECNVQFHKTLGEQKKSPNHFCCRSHAGLYNSRHKTYGIRRSKLEEFLEKQLTSEYPNLYVEYNYRHPDIGYELDIYFPTLSLAIEINGIIHYKAIYGEAKLARTQAIDKTKAQKCDENNIAFITIPNIAALKQAKLDAWKEISNILKELVAGVGFEPT